VCASVGDCKAYHYDPKESKVTDITFGSSQNVSDKDCGGRLGPFINGRDPDLRNRACYFSPCRNGDFIIITSDGVHDNLDPENLGKCPRDLGYNEDKWENVPKEESVKIKSQFACSLLVKCLEKCSTSSMIGEKLIEYARNVTKNTREFLEQNPMTREPDNLKDYPGKMDHTSCICFSVGQ